MTPQQCAAACKRPVMELGAAFGICAATQQRARELGLSAWSFYIAGRGGALGGDVRTDTVAAALGFVAPDAVRSGWEEGRRVGPVSIANHSLAEWCRFGAEVFAPMPRVDRLVSLAERVVIEADATALPLFAAWRSMPIPDDSVGGRAAVLVHLLREHRTGINLIASRACGLTPVEALIAGPDGDEAAMAFGWPTPHPERGPLMRKFAYADALADRIAGQAMEGLEPAERLELASLLELAATRTDEHQQQYVVEIPGAGPTG
jgi:hypothetical protein